jgi:hypothetical protein
MPHRQLMWYVLAMVGFDVLQQVMGPQGAPDFGNLRADL